MHHWQNAGIFASMVHIIILRIFFFVYEYVYLQSNNSIIWLLQVCFFYFAKKRICINFGILPFRMLLINLNSDIKKITFWYLMYTFWDTQRSDQITNVAFQAFHLVHSQQEVQTLFCPQKWRERRKVSLFAGQWQCWWRFRSRVSGSAFPQMQACEFSLPEWIHTPLKLNADSIKKKVQTKKINHLFETYKYVEEPEDSFVGQYMQNIPRLWVDDWQPVDFVFQ